jgi:hypothetical protein
MTCDHCGAPVRDEGAFCSHCGGRVKRAPAPAHRSAVAPERFDLVLADRGYAAACAHTPTTVRPRDVGAVALVVIGIVMTTVIVSMVLKAQADHAREMQRLSELVVQFEMPGIPMDAASPRPVPTRSRAEPAPEVRRGGGGALAVAFFPGLLVVWGVVLLATRPSGPVTREVRVVVDERVTPGGSNSLRYHATLQDREGRRTEYRCESWLAGRIAASDIGVAFVQGKHLVDFIRFEV